jgi:arylsulfatase
MLKLCHLLLVAGVGAVGWAGTNGFAADKAAVQPNIVLIVADDMGYSDIGCYGSEIRTPNLDRLAREGLRFTQFYNNAKCIPTRASLMTGLYPRGDRARLTTNMVTVAEVLRDAGYQTALSGKCIWEPQRRPGPLTALRRVLRPDGWLLQLL